MSHKDEYLDQFDHLESALLFGAVPEALRPMLRTLREKLLAEKARYLAQWDNAEGRTQTPSMGVIETYAEKTEVPAPFFGTDIRSRNRIRVRISQASVDEETGQIHREGVITESVMTESQFGEIIGNQNRGSGYPVTNVVRNGNQVEDYDPAEDATKDNAQRTLGGASRDPGLGEQLNDIKLALDKAHEAGRMKKTESAELAKNLNRSIGAIVSNTGFQVDQISEMYAAKTAEAALTIHLDAGSMHRPLLKHERD